MLKKEFEQFAKSIWGLELWLGDELARPPRLKEPRRGKRPIFRSKKSGVGGLLDFINKHGRRYKDLIIFDKIVGRGASLLAAYLEAQAVYGKTGSQLAAKTLRKYQIEFHFQKTVPNILNKNQTDLCPFEKLSLSKTPEELYNSLLK